MKMKKDRDAFTSLVEDFVRYGFQRLSDKNQAWTPEGSGSESYLEAMLDEFQKVVDRG